MRQEQTAGEGRKYKMGHIHGVLVRRNKFVTTRTHGRQRIKLLLNESNKSHPLRMRHHLRHIIHITILLTIPLFGMRNRLIVITRKLKHAIGTSFEKRKLDRRWLVSLPGTNTRLGLGAASRLLRRQRTRNASSARRIVRG